jgi:NADH-quinone oxidoreductase subunit J
MTFAFYLSSAIALFSTAMVITRKHPVHALLYLVVSLLSLAMVFFTLGAELVALLEVMVYAGAIMVLFVFMIMMLNLGPPGLAQEKRYLPPGIWAGPALLCGLLAFEMLYVLFSGGGRAAMPAQGVGPKAVGFNLLNEYYLGVELASMILLAGLVGAFHLGKRDLPDEAPGGES